MNRLSRRRALGAGLGMATLALGRSLPGFASELNRLTVVSPPNPHVFPLLLALHKNPRLPVNLLPVGTSGDVRSALATGGAQAALLMTYMAPKVGAGAGKALEPQLITTWRGFFQIGTREFSRLADLKGQVMVISGPVGSGRGGGGDLIFRALCRREGLNPDTDFRLTYLPVAEGSRLIAEGKAASIALPSPASSGMLMRAMIAQRPMMRMMAEQRMGMKINSVPLYQGVDYQAAFGDLPGVSPGELPLGGLYAAPEADAASLGALTEALAEAIHDLAAAPQSHVETVLAQLRKYYAAQHVPGMPAMLLERAIADGDLVYRAERPGGALASGLSAFLSEVAES